MPSTIRGSDNFDTAGGNAVKAWVNFNGTGTVAIRASYNVTSITDNGTGDYTLNFTTALPDRNYSINATANFSVGVSWVAAPKSGTTPTTSAVTLLCASNNGVGDFSEVSVSIFR